MAPKNREENMKSTFTIADVSGSSGGESVSRESVRARGYHGIWFELGQRFDHGDKYSGGLGTYTANHLPMAVYDRESSRTFFTYGGTPAPDRRALAIMVSWFDHTTGRVPRPVVLYFDPAVNDPHDNASIHVDHDGFIWVFKSGRGTKRPGLIFRSTAPHSIDGFEMRDVQEFTYPQPYPHDAGGIFLLFTKYTGYPDRGPARNLFWKTSLDGCTWSEDHRLAGFDGHYQASGSSGTKIGTFFNWHPGGDVDKRTNLYYAQTIDRGKTWTTADGSPLALPLDTVQNEARVIDLEAAGRCMYTCDLNFDQTGNPILLYVASGRGEPGPPGDPREWTITRWTGAEWITSVITTSDHNYDMGSLYIDGNTWRVIGPTETGPQPYGTGGEMALWVSHDAGASWTMKRQITADSEFNHSYARRPHNATDPFYAFWADGHPHRFSESRLYFCNSDGSRLRRLPLELGDAEETIS